MTPRLSVWDVGIFLIGRVWTWQANHVHARMPRQLIVLIGTLSSNQKDVSPFPILSKKKCSMEFQILKGKLSTHT